MDPSTDPILAQRVFFEVPFVLLLFFFPTIVKLTSYLLRIRRREEVIDLRGHFGAVDIFLSFFWLCTVFVVLFVILSGYGSQFSVILKEQEPSLIAWIRHSLDVTGFGPIEANAFLRVRIFFAALAAATFAVPMSFATAMIGPRLIYDRIFVSQHYIKFPARCWLSLRCATKQNWPDLVAFEREKKLVIFRFKSGRVARLPRSDLTEHAMSALLQNVVHYAPQAVGLCANYETQPDPTSPAPGEDNSVPSYTQMWDEDFQRHYRSTTFIPLSVNDNLQQQRYKIVDRLATSAMSAVYLAVTNDRVTVVIKESVAVQDSDAGRKAKDFFLRECESLSKLDHPRIARVLDSFVERGRCYLVLEHVAGKDLSRLVEKSGPLSELETIQLAIQICETVSYLHAQDPPIIHRDITPHNLVVDHSKQVHVIDFGAANRFQANVTGTMVGKQSYVAPEQLRGKAVPQSDVYSLGATLFTLLTGKEPEALSVCSPRELNANVSEELNALIEDCTRFETAERISSVGTVKSRLEDILAKRETGFRLSVPDKQETVRLTIRSKEEQV